VIDRRDMDNYRSFPVWKIDSQRLLQKYEAFEQDGRLLHRAICTVWQPVSDSLSVWSSTTLHNCTRF